MDDDRGPEIAHRRLADTLRHLQRYSRYAGGSGIEDEAGALLVAGATAFAHPYVNAALRLSAAADAREIVRRAEEFFAARERRFVLWIAGERDADLERVAIERGYLQRHPIEGTAEMQLDEAPGVVPSTGIEITRVHDDADASLFQLLVARAYAPGVPDYVTLSIFAEPGVLTSSGKAAFIGRIDGEPAASSMVLFDTDVAEVGFVGTKREARGRGLGRAVTVAAARHGFEAGASIVLLQASAMREPLYRRMGFREILRYRRYDSPEL